MYFHDGSASSPSDAFLFSVSDSGGHEPAYRHFRIAVLPLQLTLVNATPIAIDQVSVASFGSGLLHVP